MVERAHWGFGVVELAGLQQSRPAQDGVERRSQLMGRGWPENSSLTRLARSAASRAACSCRSNCFSLGFHGLAIANIFKQQGHFCGWCRLPGERHRLQNQRFITSEPFSNRTGSPRQGDSTVDFKPVFFQVGQHLSGGFTCGLAQAGVLLKGGVEF